MTYFLAKADPETYSIERLEQDKEQAINYDSAYYIYHVAEAARRALNYLLLLLILNMRETLIEAWEAWKESGTDGHKCLVVYQWKLGTSP